MVKSQRFLLTVITASLVVGAAWAQPPKRKATRSKPPEFDAKSMENIFFADVRKQLQGEPPKATDSQTRPAVRSEGTASPSPPQNSGKTWDKLISSSSIEDLVKGAKLRLDGIVTTPAKFLGGGFKDARREYTLLAMLFGIIEQYPTQVRWKNSAPVVRTHMVRVAASSKVGSPQAHNEAKSRLAELGDLVSGSTITDTIPLEELNWGEALDRVPLMLVLEWALRENLVKHCSNPKQFEENSEEVAKFAELIATIGEVLNQKGMNEADDPEYVKFSKAMMEHAQAISQAVKLNSADSARDSAALLSQTCDNCHNVYK